MTCVVDGVGWIGLYGGAATRMPDPQATLSIFAEVSVALAGFSGIVMLALQVANTFAIAESWPFFLAVVLIIAGAVQQFILLVRMGMLERPQQKNADGGLEG